MRRALWFALLLATACTEGDSGRCSADQDCPAGARCDQETSQCICVTDDACPQGSFCNSSGVCQVSTGCSSNADCEDESFCDLDTGRCLDGPPLTATSLCGLASHCPSGTVCVDGACRGGCFDSGDCGLDAVCVDGVCDPTPGRCPDSSYCPYGSFCDTDGQCREDFRGPYCRLCSVRTLQNVDPCDGRRNLCLVNSQELGGVTNFCGVDCSQGQACPNGYGCSRVTIPPRGTCQSTAECQCDTVLPRTRSCTLEAPCEVIGPDGQPDPNGEVCVVEGLPDCNGGTVGGPSACVIRAGETEGQCLCSSDDQCGDGAVCVGGDCCTGAIREGRECVVGEGRLTGFCTCTRDRDCPADSCDSGTSTCLFSGRPCEPGLQPSDCPPIACEDGLCFLGQNCAPVAGLSCSVVGRN